MRKEEIGKVDDLKNICDNPKFKPFRGISLLISMLF